MKAIGYKKEPAGEKSRHLQSFEKEMPHASGHDLLVEVKAISVNPVDYKVFHIMEPPKGEWKILGWDASGVVREVGDKVTYFKEGDEVWYAGDVTRPGSHQEFQLVDERLVGKKPQKLSFAEAAALPLTTLCAWEMLFDRMQIATFAQIPAKSILIIGAAGGVGSIMVQLLLKLTQVKVIATASRPESEAWLQQLGVTRLVNHTKPLLIQINELGFESVDYIVSLNNTKDYYQQIAELLSAEGSFSYTDDLGLQDLNLLKTKSITIHTESMYTRSMFQTESMKKQHDILSRVSELVDQNLIQTTLTSPMGKINVENIEKAFGILQEHRAHGKIVLEGF